MKVFRLFFGLMLIVLLAMAMTASAQDSLNVRQRGQIAYSGTYDWAQDVAVVGERAYVPRRHSGVSVENISNLDSLTTAGSYTLC